MLYLINIGNTHAAFAEWRGGEIVNFQKTPSAEFSLSLIPDCAETAVACVVPSMMKIFEGRENVFWVSGKVRLPFSSGVVDMTTAGADRLANVAALAACGSLPAICADFGTAVTFNLLDEHKVFRGGAIAPGRMLMRKALNNFTAQLPLTELSATAPEAPGACTRDAISLGVDRGAVGMALEILRALSEESKRASGAAPRLIGTGGDLEFYIKYIPGLEIAGKDYTLRGIAQIWEMNKI